jgi:hypothetical protein
MRSLAVAIAFGMTSPAAAEIVQLHAAGSLRAALTETAKSY